MNGLRLGIDTGGTFTDFVLYDGERLRVHKVLSTPAAPEQAILQGVQELGLQGRQLQKLVVVHGSTVATNAVLEGKGVRTVFITNHGLKDILHIGRQNREYLYDLQPPVPAQPLPREHCLEVGGRLAADGSLLQPLTRADLDQLLSAIEQIQPQAVAISLLFSFLDDEPEQQVAAVLPDHLFISRSSAVLPEYREYERGMATWLNAYVGPLMQGYLRRLQQGLKPATVAVMQSSGETVAAEMAGDAAVRLLLSGPAGGLAGARHTGLTAGRQQLLTFDMGGTSTDVALLDGELKLTSEGRIGRYPVAVPMVDMHTIGAGGGSIARVDSGGLLQVGPESAGADPGPACYGQGGNEPTVTDANLVLGRLRSDGFLGGRMSLDSQAARQAMAPVATALGLSCEQAALGIIRVANEHMVQALRVISVQRGIDPAGFTLVSFGGAGGLHVSALAESLGMQQAMVPAHAGVLSALGMLVAPQGRQLSRTISGQLGELDDAHLAAIFRDMESQGQSAMQAEGVDPSQLVCRRSADMRYVGQSYTLNVPWHDQRATTDAFHLAHQQRFGHRLESPVELVNLRLGIHGQPPLVSLQAEPGMAATGIKEVQLYGIDQPVAVLPRTTLGVEKSWQGPLLVTDPVATTLVAAGWQCRQDAAGNILLSR
jgi:N-methylhydantoinase A